MNNKEKYLQDKIVAAKKTHSENFDNNFSGDESAKSQYIEEQIEDDLMVEVADKERTEARESLDVAREEMKGLQNDKKEYRKLGEVANRNYLKAIMDEVTGLKRRHGLFDNLDERIHEIFNLMNEEGDYCEISDKKWIELFENYELGEEGEEFFLGMCDLSYLSLANEAGHALGDDLLGQSGRTLEVEVKKGESGEAQRHGGDELTFNLNEGYARVKEIVKDVKNNFTNNINHTGIENAGLKPNIDIGVASFNEGMKAFKKILQNKEARAELEKSGNILKAFNQIWLNIADKRSAIDKGITRIPLLIKSYIDDREQYDKNVSFLRKGGYNIKDSEVKQLSRKVKNVSDKEAREFVIDFIKKKEREILDGLGGVEKIKAEIVHEILKESKEDKFDIDDIKNIGIWGKLRNLF